jgi:hypothetical protein
MPNITATPGIAVGLLAKQDVLARKRNDVGSAIDHQQLEMQIRTHAIWKTSRQPGRNLEQKDSGISLIYRQLL